MKNAIITAALLLTSTLAYAGSNDVNPNDPALQSGSKKACWKTHAAGGDTTQGRVIHADEQSVPASKNARANALSAT